MRVCVWERVKERGREGEWATCDSLTACGNVGGERTVGKLLQAFQSHFELKWIGEGSRVVEHLDVLDVDECHDVAMYKCILSPSMSYDCTLLRCHVADYNRRTFQMLLKNI